MAFPVVVAMKDNVELLQKQTVPPPFASKLHARLKFHQAFKGEVQVWPMCYHPKELLEFSNLYLSNGQKSWEHMCK